MKKNDAYFLGRISPLLIDLFIITMAVRIFIFYGVFNWYVIAPQIVILLLGIIDIIFAKYLSSHYYNTLKYRLYKYSYIALGVVYGVFMMTDYKEISYYTFLVILILYIPLRINHCIQTRLIFKKTV